MQRSSLYRQWRPRRFDDMVGQEHVVTTLKNAVNRDQVAHAYIFAGPRGTGKTTAARLLAKVVNCENVLPSEAEPCNECDMCRSIDSGSSMSVVEMDAASHRGIDDIRELQERVPYASTSGRYRVYILDEAHMLTPEAFNALLKTLEEPPSHVIFVLATTEAHKIPVTVQSRCQRFDFRYLTAQEITARLHQVIAASDGLEVSESAVWVISLQAGGAVRDALGLLEQCRDYSSGKIEEEDVHRVTGAVSREVLLKYASRMNTGDVPGLMEMLDEVSMAGADMSQFIRDLLAYFRDMLLYRASDGAYEPIMPEGDLQDMEAVAGKFGLPRLLDIVDRLAETEDRSRYSTQPRFLLEMATIRLAGVRSAESEGLATVSAPQGEAPEPSARPQAEKEPPADSARSKKVESPKEQRSRPEPGTDVAQSVDLEDTWHKVKEAVRKESLPTHALLQPVRPGGIVDGAFLLVFQDQFQFHRDRTQDQGRKVLEQVIKEITGQDLRIRCLMESEMGGFSPGESKSNHYVDTTNSMEACDDEAEEICNRSGEPEDTEQSRPGNGEDTGHVVQEVLNMFSGRVVGSLKDLDVTRDESTRQADSGEVPQR